MPLLSQSHIPRLYENIDFGDQTIYNIDRQGGMVIKLIKRTAYPNEPKDLLNTPDIKVITGVRRSGKSKSMDSLENLIGEIQMCAGFEKAVNSLHAREKYDIYITGSNAFLQSSDPATLFVGRTYEIRVFPFSFSEYLKYFPSENIYGSLTKYFTDGGMAGSYLYKSESRRYRYISSEVLNALIVRDIVEKNKMRRIGY